MSDKVKSEILYNSHTLIEPLSSTDNHNELELISKQLIGYYYYKSVVS